MKLTVECYSGRKADERPVRFWLGVRQYPVKAVLDQWYEPESVFYKVRADDGESLYPSETDVNARWAVGVDLVSAG